MSNEGMITVEEGLDLIDRKYDGIGASDVERRIWDGNTDGDPWAILQQFVVADQPAGVVATPEEVGQYLSEAIKVFNEGVRIAGDPNAKLLAEIYQPFKAGSQALAASVFPKTDKRPNNVGLGSIVLDYGMSKPGQFGWSGTSDDPTFHPVLSWAETTAGGALHVATGAVGYLQLYIGTDLRYKNGKYSVNMSPYPKSFVGGGDSGEVDEWCGLPMMHGIIKLYNEESDMTADMTRIRRAVTALTVKPDTAYTEDGKPVDPTVLNVLPAL